MTQKIHKKTQKSNKKSYNTKTQQKILHKKLAQHKNLPIVVQHKLHKFKILHTNWLTLCKV